MYRRHMAEGRLADPECSMGTDPRSDPRMVEASAQFGLEANMPVVPLTIDAPLEERLAYAEMCEAGIGAVLDAFASGVPDADGVTTTTTTITGADGNDVTLYISRPDVDGPLPAVVHLHGGGMAIASAADAMYSRIREHLAGTGLVVVGVEFRNSGGKLGPHTFPAGLNDCASGVRWVAAHRGELGVSHLIVCGESAGGISLSRWGTRLSEKDGCTRSPGFTHNARTSRTGGTRFPTSCRRCVSATVTSSTFSRQSSSARSTTPTVRTRTTPHVSPVSQPTMT